MIGGKLVATEVETDKRSLILRSWATVQGIKDTASEFGEWVPMQISSDFNAALDALGKAGFDVDSFRTYNLEMGGTDHLGMPAPAIRRVILMSKVNGVLNYFTVAFAPDPIGPGVPSKKIGFVGPIRETSNPSEPSAALVPPL